MRLGAQDAPPPIFMFLELDDGDVLWVSVDAIRYDYSRASKQTAPTLEEALSVEALITDALQAHEKSKQDKLLLDRVIYRMWDGDGTTDPTMERAAADIIAMVRKHDAAKIAADHFPDIKKMVRAEARRDALEEAAQIADAKHREQCGCWCVGAAIRALANKEPTND